MGHLRIGAAVKRPYRDALRAPVIRTPAGLAQRLGRAVLWLLVVVLLLRGLAGVLEPRGPAAASPAPPPPAAAWADDGVRAFAADFARAYLTYTPSEPEASAEAVRAFVAPELVNAVVPEYGEDAPRRAVGSVSVAGVTVLDPAHALVTVAAAATGGTEYLAVTVARDEHGGLVVSELPSLVAPPARASVPVTEVEALPAGERAAIEDVLKRFFAAYLEGDAGALAYLVPAGVRIGALAQRHELVDVVSLALAAPALGRERDVVATVRARDARTRAVYALLYRVRMVRSDRWYVASVNKGAK